MRSFIVNEIKFFFRLRKNLIFFEVFSIMKKKGEENDKEKRLLRTA